MASYVLEGPRWGTGAMGTGGGTVTWAIDASVPASFVGVIQSAFATWTSVANISFQQVASTAAASIDFTTTRIDGLGNTLGFANYSFSGQRFTSATITFDSGEGWHVDGSKVVSNQGFDLYVTALHEIGHAVGLDHYNGDREVMNSVLTSSVSGLMAGDIAGIQALYGAAAAPAPLDPTASIARLYFGVLDRAPDAAGLRGWAAAASQGTALTDIARALLTGDEYDAHTTGLTDRQFVDAMYQQILGRAGDSGGVQAWSSYLGQSGARGTVANSFVDSVEFQSKYSGQSSAAYVEGLYEHVLGRTGESAGLRQWSQLLDSRATSRADVAHAFTGSAEFQQKYVGPSDAAFVDALYTDVLGRHADAGALQGWTSALAGGVSRANVAVDITQSLEAQAHIVGSIDQGWHLV